MEEDLVQQQNPHFMFLQFCAFFVCFWTSVPLYASTTPSPANHKTEVSVYIQKAGNPFYYLTRILFRFQQISLMFTCLSKVTQPLLNHLLSGWGSAMATRRKPGYRLHIWNVNTSITSVEEIYTFTKCGCQLLKFKIYKRKTLQEGTCINVQWINRKGSDYHMKGPLASLFHLSSWLYSDLSKEW